MGPAEGSSLPCVKEVHAHSHGGQVRKGLRHLWKGAPSASQSPKPRKLSPGTLSSAPQGNSSRTQGCEQH